jgi:hypothetical protein
VREFGTVAEMRAVAEERSNLGKIGGIQQLNLDQATFYKIKLCPKIHGVIFLNFIFIERDTLNVN